MNWTTVIAVTGSLLGVLLGIMSQFVLETSKNKKKRIELKNALLSEIRAILNLLEKDRKYVGILENNIKRWRKENFVFYPPFPQTLKGDLKAEDVYTTIMPVYRCRLADLGVLKTEDISKISQFYMRLMYVIYEWTLFSDKDFWGADHPREGKIKIVEQHLEEFEKAMSIAHEILR